MVVVTARSVSISRVLVLAISGLPSGRKESGRESEGLSPVG